MRSELYGIMVVGYGVRVRMYDVPKECSDVPLKALFFSENYNLPPAFLCFFTIHNSLVPITTLNHYMQAIIPPNDDSLNTQTSTSDIIE